MLPGLYFTLNFGDVSSIFVVVVLLVVLVAGDDLLRFKKPSDDFRFSVEAATAAVC